MWNTGEDEPADRADQQIGTDAHHSRPTRLHLVEVERQLFATLLLPCRQRVAQITQRIAGAERLIGLTRMKKRDRDEREQIERENDEPIAAAAVYACN